MRHRHSPMQTHDFHHGHDFFTFERFSLHALLRVMGRGHHGPHGGGRFSGDRFDFGGGDDRMPRGRKFSSDDLQLLLLALLAEEPRHGYELIKALELRSNGFYSPSAGMIYPALTYLEELGYATVETEGNRKRYALAEPGRAYLSANRERVDLMLAKLRHFARKMDSVRRAFAGENMEEATGADNLWVPEFMQARRALKHALLIRDEASPSEQRRIAAILARATAEIESGSSHSQEPSRDDE